MMRRVTALLLPRSFRSACARIIVVALVAMSVATPTARCGEPAPPAEKLRIFFSKRVILGLRDNDARAAVKVWTQIAFNENQIKAEAMTTIGELHELIAGFKDASIAAASVPTDEYFELSENVATGMLFFPLHGSDPYEEYLLLVHRDSGITNLAGLRGSKVTVMTHHRMALADIWLDTALAKEAYPSMAAFFGSVRREIKGANVVLPVFFRKAEACLISRRGFDLMTELNPQVGARLRVLNASPKLVPSLFCFNPRAKPEFVERARVGLSELHRNVFGQQILTTFQLDQLAEGSPDCLNSTRDIMKDYARWCRSGGNTNAGAPPGLSARNEP